MGFKIFTIVSNLIIPVIMLFLEWDLENMSPKILMEFMVIELQCQWK